jgi:alpha-glucosidase (family GH31 glycosyl hydrolase)
VSYIKFRYTLQPYIKALFRQLSSTGRAILRPLFMDFSVSDPYTIAATEVLNQEYMFGPRLLVAPVTTYQATNATVYLPKLSSSAPDSKWTYWWSNQTYDGGQWV